MAIGFERRHVIGEHREMSTELFAAVVTRSRKGIEAALDRGAHLDAKEKEYGDTALLASHEVIDALVAKGAKVTRTKLKFMAEAPWAHSTGQGWDRPFAGPLFVKF